MLNIKKIISIHGVPRSGTTWLGQIIDSSPKIRYKFQPLFSKSFKDRLYVRSSKKDMEQFFNELYEYEDDFLDRKKEKNKGIHENFSNKVGNPKFLAMKHVRYHYLIPQLLKKISNFYVIAIIRNPCAVLYSWKNAPKEFRDCDGDFKKEWLFAGKRNEFKPEEYFGFYKWLEATELFLQMKEQHKNRVYVLQYEKLRDNTETEIKSLFSFLDIKLTTSTIDFIEKSTTKHSADTYSIFKGNKRRNLWKRNLDKNIINKIYKWLYDTKFDKYLIE